MKPIRSFQPAALGLPSLPISQQDARVSVPGIARTELEAHNVPLFAAKRPSSIADSIRRALTSSPELSADQVGKIEERAANINLHNTMAQKAMAEVQAMNERERLSRDPETAIQYGAWATPGLSVPDATQYYRHKQGETVPLNYANDDEGNAFPPATYARPESMTPEQEKIFAPQIAATIANKFTDKTNAHQLAQAGETLWATSVRNAVSNMTDPVAQNAAKAGLPGSGYREPYSGGVNAAGLTVNQESGAPLVASKPLLDAAITASQNLGAQREAQATAAEARAALAEARARNAGGSGGGQPKAPVGYRWTQDPSGDPALEPIPGGPKDTSNAPGKPLPSSAAKALFENQQNMRRAEQALALINGAEVRDTQGNVVSKGDKDATGFKGFVPDALLQRFDAGGNATRAAIADLGSLIIHDRSGAAVTAAEFPRLQPFIPSAKDDPATVRTKLNRFVQEYRNVTGEMADFYQKSGYKVPADSLRSSGATPASAATPGQRDASGSWDGQDRRTAAPAAREQPRDASSGRFVEGPAQIRAPSSATRQTGERRAPAVGTVQDGYRFKGGDPARAESWERAR